jgi:L-lactate dehydrogenase complex protein LldE
MPRRVALFITCLTDQFYPQVGVAITRILEQFDCIVEFPQAQTCCGQPFFNNGFKPESAELARKFVRDFESYDWIVTPSGSCCAMVREHYRPLLQDDPAYAAGMERVHANLYEFIEFLDKVLKVDVSKYRLPEQTTLTYHFTCHLRGLGMKDEGARMAAALGNTEFKPLERTDQCCGFGGTFAVKYPAISGSIVEDKVNCINATGADTVICNDAGCTMNISGMCHREGAPARVRHFAELLAEAMGIDLRGW